LDRELRNEERRKRRGALRVNTLVHRASTCVNHQHAPIESFFQVLKRATMTNGVCVRADRVNKAIAPLVTHTAGEVVWWTPLSHVGLPSRCAVAASNKMQVGGRAVAKGTTERGRPPASLTRPSAPTAVMWPRSAPRTQAKKTTDYCSVSVGYGSGGTGPHPSRSGAL
jgi:hypothetical protein